MKKIKMGLAASLVVASMSVVNAQTLNIPNGWSNQNIGYTPINADDTSVSTLKTKIGDGVIINQGLRNTNDTNFPLTTIDNSKAFQVYNPNSKLSYSFDTSLTPVTVTFTDGQWHFVSFEGEEGSFEDIIQKKLYNKNVLITKAYSGVMSKNGTNVLNKINHFEDNNGYWVFVGNMDDAEKVRLAVKNFDIRVLLNNTVKNNKNWVTQNLGYYKLLESFGCTVSALTSSDETAISTSGAVTIDPTIDKNVTISFDITKGTASATISLDVVVPSQLTLNSVLDGWNKIETYGIGTSATMINGLVVSSDYANFEYYVNKPIDNDKYGTEAGIDYSVFLDKNGGIYSNSASSGEIKISIDSSYFEDGGDLIVRDTLTNELFSVKDKMAYSSYEDSSINVIDMSGYGTFRTDVTTELNLVNWELINGTNVSENIVQSDLNLPTSIGSDGGTIYWTTNRTDLLDTETGVVSIPNGSVEKVNLVAHVMKKDGYKTKSFNLTFVDSNSKAFSSISEANLAGLSDGETVVIKDKVVVKDGSTYLDYYTDEVYTTSIVTSIFKDGNEAYIYRDGKTSYTLTDGTNMTWNSSKSRWERDSDSFILIPYKNSFTFEDLTEYGSQSIGTVTNNTVEENTFDISNNLFVTSSKSSSSYNFFGFYNSYNSVIEGDVYSSNVDDKTKYFLVNDIYETANGKSSFIFSKQQGFNNICGEELGKGWRLPTLENMLNYDFSNFNDTYNYIASYPTEYNSSYFSSTKVSNISAEKVNYVNSSTNYKLKVTVDSSGNLSVGYGIGIQSYRCVFDGSLY